MGHSLGSLILFDLLAGQGVGGEVEQEAGLTEETLPGAVEEINTIEDVFAKLELGEHLTAFTDQGVSLAELETCTEEDLREAGLPLGPRKSN